MKTSRLCSIILFCLILVVSPLPNFSQRSYSDNLYEKTKAFLKEHPEQINILDSWGLGVLHRAVRNNNIRGVKLLIKKGADVNLRGILEIMPLHFAANKGNLEISKLLVSNRARIDPVMSNGWSPLHVAASKGNCSIFEFVSLKKGSPDVDRSRIFYRLIKFLLSKGADLNLSDKQGNTPFHSALIKTGNDFDYYFRHASEKRFREIQKNKMKTPKKTQKSIPYPNVGTPQIFGTRSITFNYKDLTDIKENHIDILEIMKMNGADINARNNKGFTPLHIACKTKYFNFNYSKDIYVSKWLLDNGADVNARDKMGNTPVFYVGGDVVEFNLLKNHGADLSIQNNNGETPVFYLYGKPEEILLNSGINVNHRDNSGYTLIHKAAEKLNIKKCKILIAKGADVNAASNDGTSPLIAALKHPRRGSSLANKLLQLLALGASVNHCDSLGNTPLHYAVLNANPEVYEKILKKGGKLNITNNNGETPLYVAVNRGRSKAVIFLLKQNADPNIGTGSGDTPLLSAVRRNSYSLVTELINKGADVNTPGKSGKLPLEVAVDSRASAKIIKELGGRGAPKSPEQEITIKDLIVDKKSIKKIVGTWIVGRGSQTQFTKMVHGKVHGFKCYKYYSSSSVRKGEGVFSILKTKKGGPSYFFESQDEESLFDHTPLVLEFMDKNTLVMSIKNGNTNFEVVLKRTKANILIKRKRKKLSKKKLGIVLKELWEKMKNSLINGDIDKAVSCFVHEKQKNYKQMFTALKNKMPEICRNMQPIELVYIEENGAKYRLKRKEKIKGKTYDITYYVYFVIDGDGEWRILRY
jgi:ankyrin repeat protein